MPRHHRHHRHGPHAHPGPPPGPHAPHVGPLGYPGSHGTHPAPHWRDGRRAWPPPPHHGPDGAHWPPPPHHGPDGAHWPPPPHHGPDGAPWPHPSHPVPHQPHGPHAHTWFYNDERRMSLADIAARQQAIAAQLIAGDTIDLDGLIVELPEQVQATLRHEHHGDLVLKFDLKWFDRPTALYPPHHPPHHHWVFSYEGELTLGQAGELLDRVGNQLAEQGTVTFDEHTVDVPAEALMVVRYERGPLGDLVFKSEVIWREQETAGVQRSIVELVP